ncbi:uncharacterized protein EV154DRAFT_508484 [Mucor mucedo]|uniref:uncharacterized protein n=1 Tax=Mucor mucedo TaxID=29922 RepID=UPI00221FF188|nr:uncharacterized protein EV154DRAFT_508484 [Mucor mucedo]KAI7891268.1 hypothetical protein EV154DRAFT_508484 [Mucor mucedo]
MHRHQPPDAFSKTLESKHRSSYIQHLQHEEDGGGSTVNRLSRVFEPVAHLEKPKPVLPSKPPSLRPKRIEQDDAIDQTPIAFKDIRARFQQENTIPIKQSSYRPPIPLKPSKTGPPTPAKLVSTAKTGPPALPAKPKLNFRKEQQTAQQYNPQRQSSNSSSLSVDTANKSLPSPHIVTSPSSMLHIPVMISRTTTGNSSIKSSTSTSSQNSSSTNSKRGWHISSWFTNQQQQQQQIDHENLKNSITRPNSGDDITSLSPQVTGGATTKRFKVIQELLETERTYKKDMLLLKEIYYDQATTCFTKSNVRHLFSNLLDIIAFEKTFVAVLENSCEKDCVGTAFRESMSSIDSIYSEYCKRHEDAVLKLQELESQAEVQAFLAKCKEQIQGKTTSWDLGSLLIKPVQRVLKYPLLLREILALTSPTHNDHDDLSAAVKEIQEVADNINEIKRRKDIVEKIVGDKKKTDINLVHGINKRITRRAQKFKQATGFAIEPTHDLLFEALHVKFEEQQEDIRQLARDVQGWVRHVKIGFDNLQQLACSMETLYGSWGGVRVKGLTNINDFHKMASYLSATLSRELDNDVRGFVYSRIDDCLKVFENPTQVINKRALKMIDYDRVRDLKSKGDIPDKSLQESADAYVSINAQLVDELPKFFQLTSQYFDILTGGLALVQLKFFGLMQREWVKLVEQNLGMQAASSYEEIVTKHMDRFDKVEDITSNISIIHKQRYTNSLISTSSTASLPIRQRSQDVYSQRSIADSDTYTNSSFISNVFPPSPQATKIEDLIDLEQDGPVLTSKDFECVVLYDFGTHEEERLDVKKGTILRISQDEDYIDQNWWFGTTIDDHRSGWIPINYCKRL